MELCDLDGLNGMVCVRMQPRSFSVGCGARAVCSRWKSIWVRAWASKTLEDAGKSARGKR